MLPCVLGWASWEEEADSDQTWGSHLPLPIPEKEGRTAAEGEAKNQSRIGCLLQAPGPIRAQGKPRPNLVVRSMLKISFKAPPSRYPELS